MGAITEYEVDLKQYIKGERDGEVLIESFDGFSMTVQDTSLNILIIEKIVFLVVGANIVCYGEPTTSVPFFTQEGSKSIDKA